MFTPVRRVPAPPAGRCGGPLTRRRRQGVCQQCDQRLVLHVGRRPHLLIRSVQRSGRQPCLAVDQLGDPAVDGPRGDDAPRSDGFGLTDPVAAVDGLGLLRVRPGQLGQHDVGGDLQVDPHAGRRQRADRDGDVRIVDEGINVLLPRHRSLVAADRGESDPLLGEGLLCDVHDVDVLGEEDHLARAARELRRVVGGEAGFRLADAAHHAEHVLAGGRRACVLLLPRGDLANEIVVDALDGTRPTVGQSSLIARYQPASEVALGRPDRTADLVVELDGQIGSAAGRDVSSHIDLAASDDAELDHALASRWVETGVRRRQAGVLQGIHQLGERLGLVDPTEELPDSAEVVDVVDQRGAGESHQQGARGAGTDSLGELEDVLRALRALVLDEVRLVDDHAAEPELAEPPHVAVEHLVVDHDDVGEAVDRVAVAVDDGDRAVRCPQADLAGPVDLHDARYDGEQRVGVRRLGGEQRLRRLAQPRLVGQQERPVAGRGGGDHPRLVRHQLQVPRNAHRGRCRQGHARRGSALGPFEGVEQRLEQLPPGQPAGTGRARPDRGEVRREERGGELPGGDRHGYDPTLHAGSCGPGSGRRDLLRSRFDTRCSQHVAAKRPGRVGDAGVLREEREECWVADSGLREDRRDAVQALQLLGAVGLAAGAVLPNPGVLLAHKQCDDLELGAH
jgi:hypothetical protein